jgi:hypothetical protein
MVAGLVGKGVALVHAQLEQLVDLSLLRDPVPILFHSTMAGDVLEMLLNKQHVHVVS